MLLGEERQATCYTIKKEIFKESGETMRSSADYSLSSSFDIRALWTANFSDFSQSLSGILSYQTGEITLTLFGEIDSLRHKRMLYGYTEHGHFMWIPNFDFFKSESPSAGYAVNHYIIDACFIFENDFVDVKDEEAMEETFKRIFIKGRNDFRVKSVTFSTNHLLEWIGQEVQFEHEKEKKNVHVPYGIVKARNFELENQLSLRLQLNQELLDNETAVSVQNKAEVRIEKENETPVWFQELHREIQSIVKLIEFLGGRTHLFEYLRFNIEPGLRGGYLFEQHTHRMTYPGYEVHTTFMDIEKEFGYVLKCYGKKRKKLDLVIDDYLSEFYLEEFYETKLLNAIRNLEIYHRNFIEPRMDNKRDEQQEAAREQIIQFINSNLPEAYQGRFRSQIYYRPEKSLRKRLDFLLKQLPDDIFDTLNIKSGHKRKSRLIGSFVHRIVETRHYYTHGDFPENYPNRLTDLKQIKEVNDRLRKICTYYVYKELGIPDAVILKELE